MRHGESRRTVAHFLTADTLTILTQIMFHASRKMSIRKTVLQTSRGSVNTITMRWKNSCLEIEVQNGKNKCKAKGREV